jgi:hypothetical protein
MKHTLRFSVKVWRLIQQSLKKERWGAVDQACKRRRTWPGVTLQMLCAKAGMSRQNYYKVRKQRQRREIDESLVVDLVQR